MILERANSIRGTVRVPGDKSVAHRALILGAMAKGKQVVEGIPHAADVRSTMECLRMLGAFVEEMPDGRTLVLSRDFANGQTLDAGNSGTTTRLLAGMLAGSPLSTTVDGDDSLRRRPMSRVADPLRQMGAKIDTAEGGLLPMTIRGGGLHGIDYHLPVASAQVKSAILIAGLLAEGETTVVEPVPTRDHTERLLQSMSDSITIDGTRITVKGGFPLRATRVKVPADLSSAAFFAAAAACLPESEVYLPTTGINPTRTGVLDVLTQMGTNIEYVNEERYLKEPVADIVVKTSRLHGTTIGGSIIPRVIDELPILAVVATQAEGETVIENAQELRHKESDRIVSIVTCLKTLGADIEERPDGFVVRGPTKLVGGRVPSYGDHRIAMAMAVGGLLAEGRTQIEDSEVIDISYPSFFNDVRALLR